MENQIAVAEENQVVTTIKGFIDQFLQVKAHEFGVEHSRLSVWMGLETVEVNIALVNRVYLDNKEQKCFAPIKEVMEAGGYKGYKSKFGAAFIRPFIINGFNQYAQANGLDAMKLKAHLFYKEGMLSYNVFYENKMLDVDLVEFFTQQ